MIRIITNNLKAKILYFIYGILMVNLLVRNMENLGAIFGIILIYSLYSVESSNKNFISSGYLRSLPYSINDRVIHSLIETLIFLILVLTVLAIRKTQFVFPDSLIYGTGVVLLSMYFKLNMGKDSKLIEYRLLDICFLIVVWVLLVASSEYIYKLIILLVTLPFVIKRYLKLSRIDFE